MNKYEYGYMRKQAAINDIATLYTAMKGILRVKEAYGGGSPKLDRQFKREADALPLEEVVRRLQAHNASKNIPGHPRQYSNAEINYYSQRLGKLAPGRGLESFPNNPFVSEPMTPQEKFQMSNPKWKPLKESTEGINPALAERFQTVKNLGGLDYIKELQGDNSAVEQIRRTAGQGSVGGSGMTRQDFIDNEAAANERKNQAQEKLQRHKARVDAATAAQASGTAEVPPAQPQGQPQPQPQDQPQAQPNKLGYGSMALRGGAAAGGALLGGGLGYGAARGLGLYNEDAGTGKRMLGHLLTAGGAIGGGIGGYYGGSALDKYLAARRAAK